MPRKQNETVTFAIEGIPPSLNHAYGISAKGGKVRYYPNDKLKVWQEIVSYCPLQQIKSTKTYGVEILFFFPLTTKAGKLRRKDLDNMLKYIIDPIIKRIETYNEEPIDDCQLVEIHAYKCDSPIEKTEVSFYAMV